MSLNYYLGLKRGANFLPDKVVAGTSTAGTAVDVEVNIQITNGSTATGIRRKEVIQLLKVIEAYIQSGGLQGAGTYLPAG
jgi:hypothetical protein